MPWDAGSGNWERTLVGRSRRVGSSPADGRWGTDDGGDRILEGGRLNTRLWTERRQKGRTERGDGQDVLKNKAPERISEGGGKGRNQRSSRTGNIETLKIGPESRGIHSLCSGMELHHPIMSKLWDLGGRTKREKKRGHAVLPSYPNFSKRFIINTGARKTQLGGVDIQNGKPIALYSLKLTPEQISYTNT